VDAADNVGWRDVISRDDIATPGSDGREAFTLSSSVGGNDGKPGLWVQSGGNYGAVVGPDALATGWHHLAGVRSGTTLQIFVDGVLRASANTTTTGVISPESELLIGASRESVGFGEFLKGRIDETAVFRRALSPAEVQTLCTSGVSAIQAS